VAEVREKQLKLDKVACMDAVIVWEDLTVGAGDYHYFIPEFKVVT